MALTATVPACDLVIFGTKGDLARRKLLPSLYQLEKAGNIHPETRIIGAGRADWSREEYQKFVEDAFNTFLNEQLDPCLLYTSDAADERVRV